MQKSLAALYVAAIALTATGCATSRDLDRADSSVERQPIVVANGAVSEVRGEQLLVSATGDRSNVEEQRLARLTDAIRQSISAPLVAGNSVVALVDGPATFAAIEIAIAGAKQHIHVETYIFADDELGRKFSQSLIAKRQQGVEVRVIYDAVGSIATPGEFFTGLKDAGVEVREFRPINPVKTWFWKMHNRDHRKIIVVDGRIAFTGGLNISGAYSAASSSSPGPKAGLEEGWRDTHVQIAGPVVAQFQRLFLDTWSQLGGEITQADAAYIAAPNSKGESLVSAVASSGKKEKNEAIYQTYLAAIRHSSQRIWITQAYFSPPAELREALMEAVRRGVDVRVIVPGFTDSRLVLHASRSEYERLLAGGVRLVEARNALLHAKTALIDDSLSIIGSANLDYRSFLHNNEVTAIIIDTETAKRMQRIFQQDLAQGKELTLEEWRERPFAQRAKETLSSMFKFWL